MAYADTYSPDYKKLYEAAQGNVNNAYQTQRNALNEQQAGLSKSYQDQKNQAYAQAEQTRKALDETNAQRGLYRSGTGYDDVARTYATRDNAINNLSAQEQQARDAYGNRLAELNNQQAAAVAQLQGQEGQDLRSYDLNTANLLGSLNGQQTMAAKQLAEQIRQQNQAYGLNLAQLSGELPTGKPTLAAQNQNQNYGLNLAQITGMYGGQKTADQQAREQAQYLAAIQALQNYNLGVGQVTDTLPQFPKYTYGDTMTALLQRLAQ